jgi:glutamate/tyrosine decarboxylase-like PLP-dependent enzyme
MSWQHLGTDGLGGLIEHNDDLAAYLASRLRDGTDFELTCEPELSVVCFRHLPAAIAQRDEAAIDRYQAALQRALEIDGSAWVSVTTLRGATYLRAGIVNPHATRAEIDTLLAALRRLSEGVLEDLDRG